MAEIIQFADYKKKGKIDMIVPFNRNVSFFTMVQETLSQEDYLEFLEASLDAQRYQEVDQEIRDLVDAFYDVKQPFVSA
jgi:hypothetical protein